MHSYCELGLYHQHIAYKLLIKVIIFNTEGTGVHDFLILLYFFSLRNL